MTHWTDTILSPLRPCRDAMDWARTQPDLATAWATCPRGDWMLWLWDQYCGGPMDDRRRPLDDRRRPLVLAACECARSTLPIFEAQCPNDKRPRAALELAERWGRGDPVTREALASSYASAASAAATYASAASAAAASAAYASAASAAATYASAAATYASYVASSSSVRMETLARCADIVRRHMPTPAFLDAAGGAQ